jgi:Putative peptidoglycan binding domain
MIFRGSIPHPMQSLCTLRNHCRQWPRNTRYQADATPYLGRTFTGWIAPALCWRNRRHRAKARPPPWINRDLPRAPAEPEGQPSGQTASQAPAGQEKQPESGQQEQSQQEPRPKVAQQEQQPSTTQGQPPQQNISGPSQSSAQSHTGPAVGQPQPNQLGQNQQATATSAAGPVNLTREQLQQAQTLLNEKGFNVGDVDGVLGPRTRRAVMAFQRQRGLEPSGQIDQQTATALGLSIASTSGRSVTGPQ